MTDVPADVSPSRDLLRFDNEEGLQACAVMELMIGFDDAAADDTLLIDAYGRCWATLAPHLRWFRTESIEEFREVRPFCGLIVQQWCAGAPQGRRGLYLECSSGETTDGVGPWSLRLHLPGQQGRKGSAALRLTWPASVGVTHTKELEQVFRALAEQLPAAWGTLGYAIEYDTRKIDPPRDQALRGWCGRYLGLSLRDFDDMLWTDQPSLVSASWITLLPQDLEGLVPQGPLIRTSELPVFGDSNRQEDLSGLAALQNRIRSFIPVPEQLPSAWDEARYLVWSDRFEKWS